MHTRLNRCDADTTEATSARYRELRGFAMDATSIFRPYGPEGSESIRREDPKCKALNQVSTAVRIFISSFSPRPMPEKRKLGQRTVARQRHIDIGTMTFQYRPRLVALRVPHLTRSSKPSRLGEGIDQYFRISQQDTAIRKAKERFS